MYTLATWHSVPPCELVYLLFVNRSWTMKEGLKWFKYKVSVGPWLKGILPESNKQHKWTVSNRRFHTNWSFYSGHNNSDGSFAKKTKQIVCVGSARRACSRSHSRHDLIRECGQEWCCLWGRQFRHHWEMISLSAALCSWRDSCAFHQGKATITMRSGERERERERERYIECVVGLW